MSYRVVYGQTVVECNSAEEVLNLVLAICRSQTTGEQLESQPSSQVDRVQDSATHD
jgi:hypothetical protein